MVYETVRQIAVSGFDELRQVAESAAGYSVLAAGVWGAYKVSQRAFGEAVLTRTVAYDETVEHWKSIAANAEARALDAQQRLAAERAAHQEERDQLLALILRSKPEP